MEVADTWLSASGQSLCLGGYWQSLQGASQTPCPGLCALCGAHALRQIKSFGKQDKFPLVLPGLTAGQTSQ